MQRKRKNRRQILEAAAGRAAVTGARLARRIAKVVVNRAIKQSASSMRRQPQADARLLHDIGLDPDDVEQLASQRHVLTADPFHISLKPSRGSRTPKPRPH